MKRFLTLTEEAAFGTYAGAGAALNIRLSSSGAFKPMEQPNFWTVEDGSGLGVQVLEGTQTMALTGSLTTELTYTQAAVLLKWAGLRVNAGQTAPWTTTELPGDLASMSIDYARSYMDTGGFHHKRYLGAKVSSLSLTGSVDSPKIMAAVGIIASTPQGNPFDSSADPTGTAPALSTYPTDVTVFEHLRGGVTINGVARTNFDSWSLNLTNKVKPYFDESRFANAIRLGGRSLTIQSRFRKKSTVDDWTQFYQGSHMASATSWVLTNGTNTVTIDLGSQSYYSALDEESPIEEEHYYNLTLMNQLDQGTGNDFTLTFV